MTTIFVILLSSISALAQSWDCVRIRIQPSSLCENVRANIDSALCSQKPQIKSSKLECKNEFFAEFVFEADGQMYRSALTKSANGIWSASQPELEPVKPPSALVTENKVESAVPKYRFWAEFRVRAENNHNTNFTSSSSPTWMRLKPGFEWEAQPKISMTGEVQAVRAWGQEDYVGASSSTNSRTRTSGQSNDSAVAIHQAYLKYLPTENFDFRVGRMVLNYGDGLLVGDNDWVNSGRSFDTVLGSWKNKWGWVEAFGAKLVDRSVTNGTPGNEDLNGLYVHTECRNGDSSLDAYIFQYQDSTNVDSAGNASVSRMNEIWSYGGIAKSKYDPFFYRIEYTRQTTAVSANQLDSELGISFEKMGSHRFSAGYFYADEDFTPLFGSTHKWLGYSETFSRRNMQGQFVRLNAFTSDNLSIEATYFWFNRYSDSRSAYSADGVSLGTTSRSKELGNEIDIEARYVLEKELHFLVGYSDFIPGDYTKSQFPGIDPAKWYVQVTARF